jgi:hypothetical protein
MVALIAEGLKFESASTTRAMIAAAMKRVFRPAPRAASAARARTAAELTCNPATATRCESPHARRSATIAGSARSSLLRLTPSMNPATLSSKIRLYDSESFLRAAATERESMSGAGPARLIEAGLVLITQAQPWSWSHLSSRPGAASRPRASMFIPGKILSGESRPSAVTYRRSPVLQSLPRAWTECTSMKKLADSPATLGRESTLPPTEAPARSRAARGSRPPRIPHSAIKSSNVPATAKHTGMTTTAPGLFLTTAATAHASNKSPQGRKDHAPMRRSRAMPAARAPKQQRYRCPLTVSAPDDAGSLVGQCTRGTGH